VSQDRPRRVFFALWPDDDVARRFDEAGCQAHRTLGGRRMRRETLHLTLAFVGEVAPERLQALQNIGGAIRLPPFDLLLDHRQCLARRKIFWIAASVVPAGLQQLAVELAGRLAAADFRTEARPFAAHVTLLRQARCERMHEMPPAGPGIAWPVRDFVLAESALRPEGARYRILQRWPLDQT
jgi:2'-5' RNA ligase